MRTMRSELLRLGLGFEAKEKTKGKNERKPRNQECFTGKELADLMGTNRATYKRVNGAVRRK